MVTSRTRALAGIGAAVLVLVVVGGYFLFFGTTETKLSYRVADKTVGMADKLTVTGSVSPAGSGRSVDVQSQGDDGSWSVLGSARTDSDGKFRFARTPPGEGPLKIRAVVGKDGRYQEAVTAPTSLRVLDATTLDVTIPALLRLDQDPTISGHVQPVGEREVTLQTSTDEKTWTDVATTGTGPSGLFQLHPDKAEVGDAFLRVRVKESGASAGAVSESTKSRFEDWADAGRTYLAIVAPSKLLVPGFSRASAGQDIAALKTASASFADALVKESAGFKGYRGWPTKIQKDIDLLALSDDHDIVFYRKIAAADTMSSANAIQPPEFPAGFDTAAYTIRSTLGLPPPSNG
jgi:hypothetical protein